jgi:hypothetical protein
MEKLVIKWSKKEEDFVIHYPNKADGSFMSSLIRPWRQLCMTSMKHHFVNPEFGGHWTEVSYYRLPMDTVIEMDWIKELDRRGYDTKTLKIEIKKKAR